MKKLHDIVEKALEMEYKAKEVYASLAASIFLDIDVEDILEIDSNIDEWIVYLADECDICEIDMYMHKLHSKYPECRDYAIKKIAELRYALKETQSPGISWWSDLPTTLRENTEKRYGDMIREKLSPYKDDIIVDNIYSSWVNDHIQRAKGNTRECVIIDLYCNNDVTMNKVKDLLEKEFGGHAEPLY